MQINWYPGHMRKTKESIQKNLSLVDLVIELIDARIPYSSQNPSIDEIVGNKKRIVVLNKADLAHEGANKIWMDYFKEQNINSILIDATNTRDMGKLVNLSEEVTKDMRNKRKEKGVISDSIKAMIIGVPNVGKSTLINSLTGRRGARVGNKPGVTRANQWIKTKGKLELLDTPGILWPKFEDPNTGLNLAFTGAIKDEIVDKDTLALRLIEKLTKDYPESLEERYNIEISDSGLENMEAIGRRRGCIISGGEIDYSRVSDIVLDEFRNGILGRITLELPEDIDGE